MTLKLQTLPRSGPDDTATLIEPAGSGYILVAAEVDRRLPGVPPSREKRTLLSDCRILCQAFERRSEVVSATLFSALLMPSGRARLLKRRPGLRVAKYDVVMLIETKSIEAAQEIRVAEVFTYLMGLVRGAARDVTITVAENVRRIAPVDYQRDGVFLFNYFHSADTECNIAAWERAAGWFQQETGLDNSMLLRPVDEAETDYSVINHCRWDSLLDLIPSLLLKPTFRTRVLKVFEASDTVAMPVLYRLE